MMNKFSTIFAAAAFAALPVMASAVTVSNDIFIGTAPSFSYSVPTNENGVTFSFTAQDRFKIGAFSLTANGSNGGQDILASTYQVSGANAVPVNFSQVFSFGNQGIGFAFVPVPGTIYAAGETFTVTFAEPSPRAMSFSVAFETSPVPVPAAGLLLLGALGGTAALRRRKKAATKA